MLLSEEDRKRAGTPHPSLVEILRTQPMPDFGSGPDVRKNRATYLSTQRHLYPIPGPIPDHVEETKHEVEARDGHNIPIIIYTPISPSPDDSPVIAMIHEGGWRMGDLTDEELNCRMFTRDLGAVCINIDYRLAPEHPFPTGLNDCWDVIQWISRTASSPTLPANPRKGFIVGGSSAGGNLSAVLSQLSHDNNLTPPITGQYLSVPALMWPQACPSHLKPHHRSRIENASDPVIPASPPGQPSATITELKPDLTSPLFCPILHETLKGLPPAYFQIAGLDPLRDEGVIYAHLLQENGTRVKVDMYDGFGHMFWTNWPTLERSREFVRDTLEGVRWLLEQNGMGL